MYQLTIKAACSYVRKAMDELTSVEEIGMLVSPDAVDLHKLVQGSIVEAAAKVHSLAPSFMVDGVKGEYGKDYVASVTQDGVVTIVMLKDTARVASVQAVDSDVVVCDLIPEDSAEGRKQLNKYVRGVPDDPRVVLQKTWFKDYKPVLKYYTIVDIPSVEDIPSTASDLNENIPEIDIDGNVPGVDIEDPNLPTEEEEVELPDIEIMEANPVELHYVPYPEIRESVVEISPKLEYAVLSELTAMVLESLNEHDKAALYRDKSLKYMEGK